MRKTASVYTDMWASRWSPEATEILKITTSTEDMLKRIICDYIAGLTDRYAIAKYEEYFVPTPTSAAFSDLYLYKLAELNGLK